MTQSLRKPTSDAATSEAPYASPPALPGGLSIKEIYDPAKADAAVRLPTLLFDKRFWELLTTLLRFFVGSFLTVLFPKKNTTREARRREKAERIKDLLIELGPTFIKLGQFLSVRRDVLPEEVADELKCLQDKVPPFNLQLVRKTIVSDLGKSPEELFSDFSQTPLASASIGQVHLVKLTDGRRAVIKVQRPDLAAEFYRDLGLMRLFARLGNKLAAWGSKVSSVWRKSSPSKKSRQGEINFDAWIELSHEFGRTLFAEIDYLQEGRNADRLRKALHRHANIRIPRVIWKYTGRRVLTLEYIPGTKIDRIDELKNQGFSLEELGNMLINCYLEQFILTGFFHADPHAGNLAIDPYGNLIIYDFGMMGEITEDQKRGLSNLVLATVKKDPQEIAKQLVNLGIVIPDANLEALARAVQPFIDYYGGQGLMDLDFTHLEHDIDDLVSKRSFRLPPSLAYLLRAGSTLEGIARTLKPDFSFIAAVQPVIRKWALSDGLSLLAREGKLLAFANLALEELRSRNCNSQGNNKPTSLPKEAKQSGKRKKTQDLALISEKSSTPALPAPMPVSEGGSTAEVASRLPATETGQTCISCSEKSNHLRKTLITSVKLGYGYVAVSTVGLVFWGATGSQSHLQPILCLLIGNSVLGAIIIRKLHQAMTYVPDSAGDKKGNCK
jgi:predicted unusual protein kinase regulating ubiquinone biosynthesis (AarF/ABC1/UbiB family)